MKLRLWLARSLIGLVIAWNLQAALAFLISPQIFSSGFELSGIPGAAAVRGIALLFFMWNIPYVVACWQPIHNKLSLKEALAMQAIGVIGETGIYLTLPFENGLLRSSILRFIYFDAAGLAALVIALELVTNNWRGNVKNL